jgi:hypothetical protein
MSACGWWSCGNGNSLWSSSVLFFGFAMDVSLEIVLSLSTLCSLAAHNGLFPKRTADYIFANVGCYNWFVVSEAEILYVKKKNKKNNFKMAN